MSSSSGERWSISAGWVFRGTEYAVCADVRDDLLVVQVEDKLTADRWCGQFDAKREFSVCGSLSVLHATHCSTEVITLHTEWLVEYT